MSTDPELISCISSRQLKPPRSTSIPDLAFEISCKLTGCAAAAQFSVDESRHQSPYNGINIPQLLC